MEKRIARWFASTLAGEDNTAVAKRVMYEEQDTATASW